LAKRPIGTYLDVIVVILVSIIAGLAVISFLVGRWWTLVVPFATIPGFYLGLNEGWWGSGVGDGWQFAMFAVLGASVAVTASAVAARVASGQLRGKRNGSRST
jgi:hypothetical protein